MHTKRLQFLLHCCTAGLVFWAAANDVLVQAAAPQVFVAEVVVQGSEKMSTAVVRSYLKTRVGAACDNDTLQQDARTLVGTMMFADVRVQVETLSDGRVNVYFLLRDLAATIQKIGYRGAKHLKDDELNLLTDLRVGAPLNPVKNKLACQAIIRKYNEEGRPFADCVLLKGDKGGDTEVILQITEGPLVKIGDIQFTGNTFVGSGVLATHIQSNKQLLGLFGGSFYREMIEDDAGKLKEYYRSFGFHDVDVAHEVQLPPNGQNAVVVFHISEGMRYRLKDQPVIVGVLPATAERLKQLCKVKPPDFYNGPELDRCARAMEDYLGYGGINAEVRPVPVWSMDAPGLVTVQFEIDKRR